MKRFDIGNLKKRRVICVETDGTYIGETKNSLVKGQIYHAKDIIVGPFSTMVCLKEFPNTELNSLHFAELE